MKSPSIRETELFMDVPKNRVGGIACITSGAAARALGFNKDNIGKVKSYLEEQIDGPT
jgi:hypothetical protein